MKAPTAIYRSPRTAASLSVVEFGRQTVRSMIDRRRLPVYAAVLVEAGQGTLVTTASGTQPVAAPSLFWLMPEVWHTYGPTHGTAWDERWILFRGKLAGEFLSLGQIDA
ncbi:MAG: AraC family ligand binding domain-containing protein, partial [Devosia sp.]